jgi:hypothetical protein
MGYQKEEIIAYAILTVLSIGFFFTGHKLSHGKWLRFVAGNTFLKRDQLRTESQKANGKLVGKGMCAGGWLCLSLALWTFFEYHDANLVWFGIVAIAASSLFLCVRLALVLLKSKRNQ